MRHPATKPATGRWLLTAALAAAGTILTTTGVRQERAAPAAVAPADATLPPRLRALGRHLPTALRIPAVGVDVRLVRPGRRPDECSVAPGAAARDGAWVFYRLVTLRPGDRVTVDRADGGTATFVVTAVVRHPASAFPTARGSSRAHGAGLRLITCGGTFDRSRRSYTDNVVVYARALPG